MKRLAVILLLLTGCATPTLRTPPGATAQPTRYALTWEFEHPMPTQCYEFVVETCAAIGSPWRVFIVTNQPPVVVPAGFYRVATRIKV